ncbi:MAG TPA: CaiB/BaiF CoA-transferase family protein [Acetobacteraceae bacterium]|nr:CaiB/BaiF CoA-transferase family protein [Acetobacteraceae bacterium]
MRPLAGITVVALEHAVAAPICTRHLADLGADVIKIERPREGDFARAYDSYVKGISSFVVWLNRGKRSLTLDIKQGAARDVLDRLLARADVLVQNLAPGATKRLGLDYASLKDRFPKLIVCDISGYGEGGPFETKKAYDLLIQAESGLISVTGTPEQQSRVGISAADIATGMYANQGVLAALLRRARTGEGAHVSVAMLDALAEWMNYPMYRTHYANSPLPRQALGHPALAPYGAHRTKDGQVLFGLQNEREWATFCTKVMHRPDWIDDPRYRDNATRAANRAELTAEIEAVFADKTSREVVAILDAAGIANGRLNDARALWEHEQLAARNRWREIASSAGPLRALLPPVTFEDVEAVMGPVPELGEHTDAVLGELGYSAPQIADLRASGAV